MAARLTPHIAAIVGAALVLLIFIVGWFVLVSPQRSKAAGLSTEINAAQTQLTLALAEARTLRREQHSRAAELADLAEALPPAVRMSGILRQLSAAAAAAGVRIDSIAPQPPTPGSGYEKIPLSLSVEGRYFGLMNFLTILRTRVDVSGSKLHASGRLWTIDGIQFSGGGAGAGGTNISATITLDAYTSAGAAAATTPATSTGSSAGAIPPSASTTTP